jgi:predicted O-methyltransferase YrrM
MYSVYQLLSRYLSYYIKASNGRGHGIHSPFIYDFVRSVLNDKQQYYDYQKVENLRRQLLKDQSVVTVQDFGAGSSMDKSDQRTVASIAKNAAKPKKYGQLLYRIVKRYQPSTVLELGTSVGITTSYLADAHPLSKVITLEGAPAIAAIARKNFQQLNLSNIQLIEGNFDHTLPSVIGQLSSGNLFLAFIDGNHRFEPTISYFKQLLTIHDTDSIFIFDDIHWSPEMEKAWDTIKSDPAVRCSIDLFFIGIVFFRKEFKEKQNFVIRY